MGPAGLAQADSFPAWPLIRLLALVPSAAPGRNLADSCESLEKSITPWLSPAQIRHIRSFGSRPEAMRARLSRLMARRAALEEAQWLDTLDRDRRGRAFFLSSNAPCAFSYADGAIFSLCAPCLGGSASLALDAEKIPERPESALKMFLSRLFPSLAASIRGASPAGLAFLWVFYECALKISGAPPIDLPRRFEDIGHNACQAFYLSGDRLYFNALHSRNYIIGVLSRAELSLDIVWRNGAARTAPALPLNAEF